MASRAMLRRWSGGSWPADDFPLSGNYKDLEVHQREHLAREAFTYTVTSSGGDLCLGCVYLEPLEWLLRQAEPAPEMLAKVQDFEAAVRFWVRTSLLEDDVDNKLFESLRLWLEREWAFERFYFRTNARDVRQVQLFEGAGLVLQTAVNIPGKKGPFRIYG